MTESTIQTNICTYLSMIATQCNLVYFSVPNELYGVGKGKKKLTGPEYGMINKYKSMGLLPGTNDLVLVHRGMYYGLEVKIPTGTQSNDQELFQHNIIKAGGKYEVVRSVEEVQAILKEWGIL